MHSSSNFKFQTSHVFFPSGRFELITFPSPSTITTQFQTTESHTFINVPRSAVRIRNLISRRPLFGPTRLCVSLANWPPITPLAWDRAHHPPPPPFLLLSGTYSADVDVCTAGLYPCLCVRIFVKYRACVPSCSLNRVVPSGECRWPLTLCTVCRLWPLSRRHGSTCFVYGAGHLVTTTSRQWQNRAGDHFWAPISSVAASAGPLLGWIPL